MSEDLLMFIIFTVGYICGSIGENFSTKLFNKINKNKQFLPLSTNSGKNQLRFCGTILAFLFERSILNMAFCGTKKFRCDNDMSMFLHDMSVKLEKSESEIIRTVSYTHLTLPTIA